MNSITVTGTLGRDSELKALPSGTKVLEFSLAVNDGHGERKRTYWWRCKMFGDRAVKLEQYFKKGTRLLISGSPELREYETSDGVKKISAEIFVKEFDFFGGKKSENNDGFDGASAGDFTATNDADDDSIPF